jgi:hypothetical protein
LKTFRKKHKKFFGGDAGRQTVLLRREGDGSGKKNLVLLPGFQKGRDINDS